MKNLLYYFFTLQNLLIKIIININDFPVPNLNKCKFWIMSFLQRYTWYNFGYKLKQLIIMCTLSIWKYLLFNVHYCIKWFIIWIIGWIWLNINIIKSHERTDIIEIIICIKYIIETYL